ncbi:hypothetical protein DFJ58DRAFT_913402 [Suillus subalutaceus]|uniref:uncharacterized protein n=1 Tax=Suillus subalutaceus TaxID=48586 RepID=UPI001B861D1D|nr:uncharacterized protein DFJ58DRAFT_913402 [Suillus subalutaceus]KAG1858074.1 hypothetical protein DFJ58DRAFT_913402 [Suillus subalutaceus]
MFINRFLSSSILTKPLFSAQLGILIACINAKKRILEWGWPSWEQVNWTSIQSVTDKKDALLTWSQQSHRYPVFLGRMMSHYYGEGCTIRAREWNNGIQAVVATSLNCLNFSTWRTVLLELEVFSSLAANISVSILDLGYARYYGSVVTATNITSFLGIQRLEMSSSVASIDPSGVWLLSLLVITSNLVRLS